MKSLFRATRPILMTGLLVIFSCQNMLTGDDVTKKVKGQVSAANAEVAPIAMQIDSTNGGTLVSPVSSVKVGIPFTIEAQVGSGFAFNQWEELGNGGHFKIANTKTAKTTATLIKTGSPAPTLQADFFRAPTVIVTPATTNDLQKMNVPIQLRFSHAMNPATVTLYVPPVEKTDTTPAVLASGAVEVTETLFGHAPTDVQKTYFKPTLSYDASDPSVFTLAYIDGKTLSASANYTVTVHGGSLGLLDANGVIMQGDISTFFPTGTETDNSAPTINHIYWAGSLADASALANAKGASTTTTFYTNSDTVHFGFDISSTQPVIGLYLFDSLATNQPANGFTAGYSGPGTDMALTSVEGGTVGDGNHVLTVSAKNSFGNTGVASDPISVFYDTTRPTVTLGTLTSSGGAWARLGSTISLQFTGADPNSGTTGSGLVSDITPVTVTAPNLSSVTVTFDSGTGKYTATGTLNAATFAYTAKIRDRAGNVSLPVTTGTPSFTIDTVAPTVGIGAITSNNTHNAAFAKNGDTVVLHFTASDDHVLQTPGVLINNAAATTVTNTSGINYTASSVLSGDSIAYQVTADDAATNETVVKSTVVGPTSTVTVDNIFPSVTNLAITSPFGSGANYYAKSGDAINIAFTATDTNLDTVTALINGVGVNLTKNGSNYTGSTTAGTGDGAISYEVVATDKAGNVTTVDSNASSTVTLDNIVPVVSVGALTANVGTGPNYYATVGGVVSLAFTASDTNLNPPVVKFNGINTVTATSTGGNGYSASYTIQNSDTETPVLYEIDVSDKANHTLQVSTGNSGSVTVDKAKPVVSNLVLSTTIGTAPTYYAVTGTTITLKFQASDAHLGAVTAQINGHPITPTTSDNLNYTATYDVSSDADGLVTYLADAKDLAGNDQSVNAPASVSGTVLIDNMKPTASAISLTSPVGTTPNFFARTGTTLTLAFTPSDTGSGLKTVGAKINGHTVTPTGTTVYTATYAIDNQSGDTDGLASYEIDLTDNAGNPQTIITGSTPTVTIDKATPTVTNMTISSNNQHHGTYGAAWATTGDTIQLLITTADGTNSLANLATPAVTMTIGGASTTGVAPAVTGSAGNYTVTYMVASGDGSGAVAVSVTPKNQAGAPATAVTTINTGTVTVDKGVPTVSSLVIASDNQNHGTFGSGTGQWATNSDTIQVTITATDGANALGNLALPTVNSMTIGGTAVKGAAPLVAATATPGVFTATYQVIPTDVSGAVAVSVTAKNQALTSGALAVTALTGSSVTVDNAVPAVTVTAIQTDNVTHGTFNSVWAKTGDTIKLTITGTDGSTAANLNTPTVTLNIAGTAVNTSNVTVAGSAGSYTATYLVGADTSAPSDGAVTYTVGIANKAGTSDPSPATGGGGTAGTTGNVTVDNQTPTVTSMTVSSDNQHHGTYGAAWATTGDTIQLLVTVADGTSPLGNLTVPAVTMNIGGTAVKGVAPSVGPTATPGVYAATYVVVASDGSGTVGASATPKNLSGVAASASTTITAPNVAVDKGVPTVSSLVIASDNQNHGTFGSGTGQWATNGDTIQVTITATDGGNALGNLALPTVNSMTIGGTAVKGAAPLVAATATPGVFTATYQVIPTDVSGAVAVSVTAKNQALTSGALAVTALTGSSVTVDNAVPAVTVTAIQTDNVTHGTFNSVWAKTGDTIKLTITGTDGSTAANLNTPTVTLNIAGTAVNTSNVTVAGSAGSYTATYLVGADTSAPSDGAVTYTVGIANKAGTSDPSPATGGGGTAGTTGNVTVDNQTPTVTSMTVSSDNQHHGTYGAAWATTGDTIQLLVTVADGTSPLGNLTVPAVTMNIGGTAVKGVAPSVGPTATPGVYAATYVVVAADGSGTVGASATPKNLSGVAATASTTITAPNVAVDKGVPTVSSLVIASDNQNHGTFGSGTGQWATNSDTIQVTITATDGANALGNLALPTVNSMTIGGTAVKGAAPLVAATATPGVFTATYQVIPTDVSGAVAVSVTAKNQALTSGAVAVTALTGSSVTVDNAVPAVTVTAIQTDNVTHGTFNSVWAKTGDTIKLTITGTDGSTAANLNTPTVTLNIAGTAVNTSNVTVAGSAGSYTATYLVGADTSAPSDGAVTYTVGIANKAGTSDPSPATGGGGTAGTTGNVTVDNTDPIIHVVSFTANGADVFSMTDSGNFTAPLVLEYWIEDANPKAVTASMIRIAGTQPSAAPSGAGTLASPYVSTRTTATGTPGFTIGVSTPLTDMAGNPADSNTSYTVNFTTPVANPFLNVAQKPAGLVRRGTTSGTAASSISSLASSPARAARDWWSDTTPASAPVATPNSAGSSVVSVSVIPASFTVDRLPVLADTSSFAAGVTRRLPQPATAVPVRTPVAAQTSAAKHLPATSQPAQTAQTQVAWTPVSVPTQQAPLPDTGKPAPRVDFYMQERRARSAEEGEMDEGEPL